MNSVKKLALFCLLTLGFASFVIAQSADTVWLSSLDVTKARQGWGDPHADKSVDGNPIKIAGTTYAKGFGTHAGSALYINLKGTALSFESQVGLDDEINGAAGSVRFKIYCDKKESWKSEVLKAGEKANVKLDLKGIKEMILLVETTEDGPNWDHADWAEAKFIVAGLHPETVDPPREKEEILTPKSSPEPRINGAKIYGVRPGSPFLFRVPATGKRPLKYAAKGLPQGLTINTSTGIISGSTSDVGKHKVMLTVTNSLGKAERQFTIVVGNKIALTPPMGWNSWNCFAEAVDDQKIRSAADALISSGLADHGWAYINIDDCWAIKPGSGDTMVSGNVRDKDGMINSNKKFPDMKALSDYVHSKGLKIGIYSSPGPLTCADYTASYHHETDDAKQFANWGMDYLKYDWCSYGNIAKDKSLIELQKPYLTMNDALNKQKRDIVYSLCQYGMGNVWTWGSAVGGNCWRTTGDITDTWESMSGIGFGQAGKEKFAGPGHWNDPDMLVVGMVGWGNLHPSRLSPNEQYTHISLWSLLASPLLIGCDMTQMDDFTFNLLSNDEVIEINQDALGIQAKQVLSEDDKEVWAKPLEDGSLAVGLFNKGMFADYVSVSLERLNIKGSPAVRDVWRQRNLGFANVSLTYKIPAHGVKLIKLTPVEKKK